MSSIAVLKFSWPIPCVTYIYSVLSLMQTQREPADQDHSWNPQRPGRGPAWPGNSALLWVPSLCVCQQEIENFPVSDIAWGNKKNKKNNSEKKKSTEANILCSRWCGGILSLACTGPTLDRCKLQVKRRHVRAGRAQREDSGFGGIVRKQLFYGWAIGAPCTCTNWPTYWNIYLMRHWFLFSYRAPCRQSCQTPMSEFTAADLVALTAQQPRGRK